MELGEFSLWNLASFRCETRLLSDLRAIAPRMPGRVRGRAAMIGRSPLHGSAPFSKGERCATCRPAVLLSGEGLLMSTSRFYDLPTRRLGSSHQVNRLQVATGRGACAATIPIRPAPAGAKRAAVREAWFSRPLARLAALW